MTVMGSISFDSLSDWLASFLFAFPLSHKGTSCQQNWQCFNQFIGVLTVDSLFESYPISYFRTGRYFVLKRNHQSEQVIGDLVE